MKRQVLSILVIFLVSLTAVSALARGLNKGQPNNPPGNTECETGYMFRQLGSHPCKAVCQKTYPADVCNKLSYGVTNRIRHNTACNKKKEPYSLICGHNSSVDKYWTWSTYHYPEGKWYYNHCEDYTITLMPCSNTKNNCSQKCSQCLTSTAGLILAYYKNSEDKQNFKLTVHHENRALKAQCREQCSQCSLQLAGVKYENQQPPPQYGKTAAQGPSSQYTGANAMTASQLSSLQAAKQQNESAIQKAKKQRKRLMLAAFVSGGAGIYLLKTKCNPTDFPMGDGKINIPEPVSAADSITGIASAASVSGLTNAMNNIGLIGGPPKTTFGCVLGPVAIAQALMMLKKASDMKKTIAQLSGSKGGGSDDFDIPDVNVPCLEDPTKTCKLVNGGTHITSLDGSPPRSIKEVAENLPPHDEQTLAALEEAVKAQEETLAKARESLGPDFNPMAELTGQSESSTLVAVNPLPLNQNLTPASDMEVPLPSFNQQGVMPPPLPSFGGTNNWMQAQCEVENSVHTVSDVGGGMVDVLCDSSGPPANVRQTPNPPNVSSCTQEQTAVAVRDSGVNEWASVSCMDSTSSNPLVSLRTTERGQWADVTCPAVGKVVTVRMANTDRWVSVLCGDRQAGQVVSLRSGQATGTDSALYAQFAGGSYGSGNNDVESLPFGNDRIASVNENVFAIVSTQYQDQRSNGEFIEDGPNDNTPPFVIPVIPTSSGSQ